ncbi:hypothetical protein [Paraburkholderia sp.]|nr:hypothetical protein [Paraburkholderia sp.]
MRRTRYRPWITAQFTGKDFRENGEQEWPTRDACTALPPLAAMRQWRLE